MKQIIQILFFVVIAVSISSCAPSPQDKKTESIPPSPPTKLEPTKIFNKCNNAVFMCFADDGFCKSQGSGFFISPLGIGITNEHVFQENENYRIKLVSGEKYNIQILKRNKEKDYVIFRVLTDKKKRFPYIKISKRIYKVGQPVYALGSPKGMSNTFNEGSISQIRNDEDCKLIQISVPIDHGSSGGVLLNNYGEAIGITSAGILSLANLNFAIDIHELDKDLIELGVIKSKNKK